MNPEFQQARINKDKNFDGKFFFGVKTTGVFCRPSCPSPTAREENVVYFKEMFEALDQHFRPCLRCRPDIHVDYYTGNAGGTLLVNTALKMIYDGYLNDHSVADLAHDLAVSDRHLRKLFIENLGVSPVKIARYHRALFAKRLLLFSDQSVTHIAFASGFGSLRQFNQVFKETFGLSPSQVRNGAKAPGAPSSDRTPPGRPEPKEGGNMALYLPYTLPFSFSQILDFLRPRAIKGVEKVGETTYTRTFRTARSKGHFTVKDLPDKSALCLEVQCDDIQCYMEIYNRVRRMFDLDTDFSRMTEQFRADPLLSKGLIKGQVPRLPRAFDPFEFCVRAVLGQQVSVQAATTLAGRIAQRAGLATPAGTPPGLDLYFPNPQELLATDMDQIGLTRAREATLVRVAQAVEDKTFSLNPNQDFDAFHAEFSSLKGIGDWTVNYVAMRGLGMADAFPATDLGILRALEDRGKRPSPKTIVKMAEKWRPYRAHAALCLWNL